MSGLSIAIDVSAAAVRGGLRELQAAGANMRDTWDVIGRRWVDLLRQNFEFGVAPDGTPWKPSHRAEREGGQTLIDKGLLRDSLTHLADDAGVTVGTNKVQAAALNFGATIVPTQGKFLRFVAPGGGEVFAKKVTIPPRPFVGINDTFWDEFAGIITGRLRRAASAGGGDGAAA